MEESQGSGFHLRNVTDEASRSTSASGKSGSGSKLASSDMARTVLENPSADSSKRHTSTPSLAIPSLSSGGGGASGGAAIAGEGGGGRRGVVAAEAVAD